MRFDNLATAILTAVLIACCWATSFAQADLRIENQRFFTTPDQRERLDALRRRGSATAKKKVAVKKKAPPPLPRVEVQGIVVRSNGPNAAWVNDGNTLRGDSLSGGLRVQTNDTGVARIHLPNRGSVALRPGQSYDPASGETTGLRIRTNP